MRYAVADRPDWSTLDASTCLQVSRYHEFPADDSESVVVVPESSPSWLHLRRSDMRALDGLSGHTIGELRASGAFATIAPVLNRLYDAGMLFVDGATGIRVTATGSFHELADRKPRSLLVKMTGACDIACDYCYDYDPERWKGQLDMALVKRLIDECLEPGHCLTIMFHGGEPLLQFGAVQELVTYAEEIAAARGAEVKFTLQTNGIGLTPEVVAFLTAHPFGVGISLDGPEKVHDIHRVDHKGRGTFARLSAKFDAFPDFMREYVGYISVATEKTLPHMDEAWEFFQERQVLSWKILPSEPEGKAAGHIEGIGYVAEFIGFLRRRIAEITHGRIGPPFILNITQLIAPLLSLERRNMCMKMPCGAATDLLVIDAQNQLRGCDCSYHPAFLLDRNDGAENLTASALTSESARQFHDRADWLVTEADCRNCPWLHFCAGTCPARVLMRKGTVFAVDDLECITRQELFPEIAADLGSANSRLEAYYRQFAALTSGAIGLTEVN